MRHGARREEREAWRERAWLRGDARAVGEVVDVVGGAAGGPGKGLEGAAGDGEGVVVAEARLFLPGEEAFLEGGVGGAVVPAAPAFPVVGVGDKAYSVTVEAPEPPGDEAAVGFGFEGVDDVWLPG